MFRTQNGSFLLFRVAGIDVFLHWTWLVVAYFEIQNRRGNYTTPAWNVAEYVAIFGIVLLHEFGHALAWKEKGTFYGMGDGVPYAGTYAIQFPGQFKMEIENVFTIVLDGDKGWFKAGDAMDLSKEQLAEAKEEQYARHVATLLPLKKGGFTLASLGEQKVDDRPAAGVKVSHQGHRDVTLFFDKDSGLLVKTEQTVKDEQQGGKEVKQEIWYSDFKDTEGRKVPTKIKFNRDGKKFVESEMSDYKPVEKLEANTFAKP
jgi:hypothetical protein